MFYDLFRFSTLHTMSGANLISMMLEMLKTLSLYIVMHLKNHSNISQLRDFKKQLEVCASPLEVLKLQDRKIFNWCFIFLKACEDWRKPTNPKINVSIRVCQVNFAKPLSYVCLVLRSLKSLGTSLKRLKKKYSSEYGFATRQEVKSNVLKKRSTEFASRRMGFQSNVIQSDA